MAFVELSSSHFTYINNNNIAQNIDFSITYDDQTTIVQSVNWANETTDYVGYITLRTPRGQEFTRTVNPGVTGTYTLSNNRKFRLIDDYDTKLSVTHI